MADVLLDICVIARTILTFAFLLSVGCQPGGATNRASIPGQTVYSLVIADLAQKEPADVRFVGTDVWVAPQFSKGDSLFYSWGDEVDVDDQLVDALKTAARSADDFPSEDAFGPDARVTEIESFHDLHYYGKNTKPVNARCLVQFWRPGYAADGKRAVIRFFYGPSPHGAAGTYVLLYTESGWRITSSTISYYQ